MPLDEQLLHPFPMVIIRWEKSISPFLIDLFDLLLFIMILCFDYFVDGPKNIISFIILLLMSRCSITLFYSSNREIRPISTDILTYLFKIHCNYYFYWCTLTVF